MAQLTGIQRIFETGMIVCTVLALFIFLSLMSFHQADPGWTQTGLQPTIQNWMGPAGAKLADLLFFSLGYLAYSLPFLFALIGWLAFQQVKQLLDLDFLNIGLRLIGVIFIAIGISGLASINFDDMYYFSAGGLFGDVISSALLPQFNFVGTTVLLLSFFATGFTLASGISWLSVVDLIGASTLWAGKKAIALPQGVGQLSLPSAKLLSAQKDTDNSDDISISTLRPTEPAADDRPFNIKHETLYKVPEDILDDEPEVLINVDTMSSDISLGAITPEITMDYDTPAQAEPVMDAAVVSSPLVKSVMKHKHVEKPEGERPSFALLDRADKVKNPITKEELEGISRLVEEKLADFNISAQVVGVYPGPVITRFELDLAPGVKVSKITTLSKDLARAMSAISVRVVEVIPGKSVIGLELPNKNRDMVRLSEVIEGESFQSASSPLTMVLGADISGKPVVVDLAKMPHLLVAGTTGSGKSVGVNVMILSLLYKSSPEDVRMIMIDPKMLELSVYEGIPHLLAEVVTDMKEAANALRWCVGEMERRYRLMSALGVRNLKGYNAKVLKAIADGQPIKDPLWQQGDSMDAQAPDLTKLPAIVVVVDEFADMMMIVGKKVEELIARIAQKARAAGIHLILATQRPSVDVITGLIKANIPTRIAFQVSSKIDSRTILDQQGAEALLGMGDMLYLPPGTGVPTRVHGAFVDDHEVHAVVGDWKKRGEPEYIDEILNPEIGGEVLLPGEQAENADQEMDVFYDEAVAFVTETRKASVSSVQRKFRIGYNRAARLVEQMEQSGIVSAPGHNGNREVLAAAAPRD
ncbi:DNA translocase FtsK 4TM domain-containing protein [Glaciecola sp.]|jgi:S-DNA-T family DNA segregation ATPase FtsK/SpoIIIE|nr:DNA translocase FtsK 4TM domain-containing protein [Glaciecola sp.]